MPEVVKVTRADTHPEDKQKRYLRRQRGQSMYRVFSVQNEPLDNDNHPDRHQRPAGAD